MQSILSFRVLDWCNSPLKRPGNFTQTMEVRNRAMAFMDLNAAKAADTVTSDKIVNAQFWARSLAVVSNAYAVHVECQGAQEQTYMFHQCRVQITTMGHIVNAFRLQDFCSLLALPVLGVPRMHYEPIWYIHPPKANTLLQYTTRCIL